MLRFIAHIAVFAVAAQASIVDPWSGGPNLSITTPLVESLGPEILPTSINNFECDSILMPNATRGEADHLTDEWKATDTHAALWSEWCAEAPYTRALPTLRAPEIMTLSLPPAGLSMSSASMGL